MDTTIIKSKLNITSNAFDNEIGFNITASLADMNYTTDITNLDEEDPNIIEAVSLYCGWKHNLNHGSMDLADRCQKAYEEKKKTLLMSSQYTTYDEDEDE